MNITKQQLTPEQYELFKNAEMRMKQKRLLYIHFLDYLPEYNWWQLLSALWLFLWLWHAVNVFFFSKFLGKQWREKQREQLIAAQQKKIIKMEAAIERDFEQQKQQAQRELAAAEKAQQNNNSQAV